MYHRTRAPFCSFSPVALCTGVLCSSNLNRGNVSHKLRVIWHGNGCVQVFELEKHRPDKVLKQLWANFDELGSTDAQHLRSNLRILTAGGDGTVAWVLQVRAFQV